MTEDKLTDWYPSHIRPVRPGVYEARVAGQKTIGYAAWDGKYWGWRTSSFLDALKYPVSSDAAQDKQWRGLKAPAE